MSSTLTSTVPTKESHNIEAERTVLGALLFDTDAVLKIADWLHPDDFYDPIHRDIYRAILSVHQEGSSVDIVIISDRLKNHQKLQELGGSAFLAQLAQLVPTASHIEQYAQLVKDRSERRYLAKIGSGVVASTLDPDLPTSSIIEQAQHNLDEVAMRSTSTEWEPLATTLDNRYESYSEAMDSDDPEQYGGLRTGFYNLDKMIDLEPGHLMVLAARPSMGKTSLALNIACNAAQEEQRAVAFFSCEMKKKQLVDRMVAAELGVESQALKRGQLSEEKYRELGQVMDRYGELNLFIDDEANSVNQICRRARKLNRMQPLGLIVIDYLQIVSPPSDTKNAPRVRQIGATTKLLKQLSLELGVPVIVLSQLSRACEQRNPNRPVPHLADLRDSGEIEEDADSVVMLYRHGRYDPDCEHPTHTEVLIEKNRDGATGSILLDFDQQRVRFTAVTASSAFEPTDLGAHRVGE